MFKRRIVFLFASCFALCAQTPQEERCTAEGFVLQFCAQFPDAAFMQDKLSSAIQQRQPAALEGTLKAILSYATRYFALQTVFAKHCADLKINTACLEYSSTLQQLREKTLTTFAQNLECKVNADWHQCTTTLLKRTGQTAISSGVGQMLWGIKLLSPLSCVTMAVGAGLVACYLFSNQQLQKNQRREALNQRLSNLQILGWHMRQLVDQHKNTTTEFEGIIKCLPELYEKLKESILPVGEGSYCEAIVDSNIKLCNLVINAALRCNDLILEQKLTFRGLTKVMRALGKSNASLVELMRTFCQFNTLLSLDPANVQTIKENHEFLQQNFRQLLACCNNMAVKAHGNPQSDFAGLFHYANVVLETCKMFFAFRKPEYYEDVLERLICETKEETASL